MPESYKLLLCVEDDLDDCAWIQEAAAEVDPKLEFAHKQNGQEALQFLQELKERNTLPCLILLDINMPILDGKETLKMLKKDRELRDIPVVVFTTSANIDDRLFFQKYNVEVVTKPSGLEHFHKVIEHIVLSRCA